MLQLLIKNKIALVMCTVVAGLTVLMLGMGISFGKNARISFPADGYVLGVEMNNNDQVYTEKDAFHAGAKIEKKASDQIAFTDIEGNEVSVHKDSFIHYENGSLTSVNGMILTELSEFSEGIMDSYYLDGMMSLEKENNIYKVRNNETELKFENFVLKTGKNHYLLVSPGFEFSYDGKNIESNTGVLELVYRDDNATVAALTDGLYAWQFLTDECAVTFDNGVQMDLSDVNVNSGTKDKETGEYLATLDLRAVEVSPDAGIIVSSASADEWIAPTFVIHSEDGEDGEDGEEGIEGESGKDGEEGEKGEEGAKGEDGAVGKTGEKGSVGKKGLPGKDGDATDEEEPEEMAVQPSVNITSWEQTAGSVDFKLCAYNTELVKEGTTEAYVLNTATGAVNGTWARGMELKAADGEETSWRIEGLEPNTQYKLVISAMVLRDEGETDAKYAKTILLSRMFSTDENGFYLKKVQSAYINEDNIGEFDQDAVVNTACIGFQAKLSGNQKLREISKVEITYREKNSGVLVNVPDGDNPFTNEEERNELKETVENGSVYLLHNLKSNTEYTIKVTAVLESGAESVVEDTYLTLKATPIVTKASFHTNENRFFISTATLYKDEDQAITHYDHEIYRYYSGGLSDECLKKKTTSIPETYIYLSSTIFAGKDYMGANYEYGNRIFYTWFDNEKYVTKEVAPSSSWKAQHIADSDNPYIELKIEDPNNDITANSVKGELVVHSGSGYTIYVGDKDVHRLLVQVTSAGYTKVFYYSDLSEWLNSQNQPMAGTQIHGEAKLPLELTGLAPGTTYSITVTAYFDAASSESKTVGTTVIKTDEQ